MTSTASTALILTDFPEIAGVQRGIYRVLEKPLIEYVLEAVPDEVDEIIIAAGREEAGKAYADVAEKYFAKLEIYPPGLTRVLKESMSSSKSERFLILPCDSPLLTQSFTKFLLDACEKFTAVIIRDANGRSDYLFSCFRRFEFLEAAESAGSEDMDLIVQRIRNAIYFYRRSLRFLDEKLLFMFRVTNVTDAKRAERLLRARQGGEWYRGPDI
ncbi:MAG: NTP transferase domain-containing protein [Candidatus Caldarchaeales archaeon]|jgi:molybdopterin-guanine dinucleotide biosynthesis protein A|nr:NTP transferase domain-containing protein [Candidatus Caldarchaeales archaeon]MDT7915432.1 NTP transferase domain-containing protein [Candidatus Caldarchaeales archaeon]